MAKKKQSQKRKSSAVKKSAKPQGIPPKRKPAPNQKTIDALMNTHVAHKEHVKRVMKGSADRKDLYLNMVKARQAVEKNDKRFEDYSKTTPSGIAKEVAKGTASTLWNTAKSIGAYKLTKYVGDTIYKRGKDYALSKFGIGVPAGWETVAGREYPDVMPGAATMPNGWGVIPTLTTAATTAATVAGRVSRRPRHDWMTAGGTGYTGRHGNVATGIIG